MVLSIAFVFCFCFLGGNRIGRGQFLFYSGSSCIVGTLGAKDCDFRAGERWAALCLIVAFSGRVCLCFCPFSSVPYYMTFATEETCCI